MSDLVVIDAAEEKPGFTLLDSERRTARCG